MYSYVMRHKEYQRFYFITLVEMEVYSLTVASELWLAQNDRDILTEYIEQKYPGISIMKDAALTNDGKIDFRIRFVFKDEEQEFLFKLTELNKKM